MHTSVFPWQTQEKWLSEVTVLEAEAVEVMGDHGVNGPVPSPRGMFLKQMVSWVGKVGSDFTCLFICYIVLKLFDGKQLKVNDPLCSRPGHVQTLSFQQQEAGTLMSINVVDFTANL